MGVARAAQTDKVFVGEAEYHRLFGQNPAPRVLEHDNVVAERATMLRLPLLDAFGQLHQVSAGRLIFGLFPQGCKDDLALDRALGARCEVGGQRDQRGFLR